MAQVWTIGEALIDFIPEQKGVGLKDVVTFKKAPGGAPANVAAAVSILGGKSAFIGKLGKDAFGDYLVEVLEEVGVETKYIKRTNQANTALAFVSLKEDGERDFSFYRNPSADMLLNEEEIDRGSFNQGDILHFCSVSLVDAPVRQAHVGAIKAVQDVGGIICFDPNIRLPLWDNHAEYRRVIQHFLPEADILKISEDELEFITEIKNEKEAINSLLQLNAKILIVTRGGQGVSAYAQGKEINVPGYSVDTVDTTGAGDSFIGSFLHQLVDKKIDLNNIQEETLKEMLLFSNAAAALTTTKQGAITALPGAKKGDSPYFTIVK
ncbi:MAG TPA: aminoimidazole riboside kinase [Epulopiscium sp.]|nr:aminoimidazole riboside kinase [Candidatus Epulonipiscium sp.]